MFRRERQNSNTLAFSQALQKDVGAVLKAERIPKSGSTDLRKDDLLHRAEQLQVALQAFGIVADQ